MHCVEVESNATQLSDLCHQSIGCSNIQVKEAMGMSRNENFLPKQCKQQVCKVKVKNRWTRHWS